MRKVFLFLSISISGLMALSQPFASEDVIRKGVALYGEEKYTEAINVYQQVHENDPNYTWMLAELALTYLKTEQYDSVIFFAQKGLDLPTNSRQHLMRSMGTAYDFMDLPEKTIEIYTQAIEKFPYAHLLHFNLGITYMKVESFEEAIRCFQEALRCNPYHASSHLQLGRIMAWQGQFARAMLGLQTFLAIEPTSARSNEILVMVEDIASNAMSNEKYFTIQPFTPNELFEPIDNMLKSRVVLTDRFEPIIDFNANLVKQNSLLFETLPFDTREKDFWVEMYFPFFNAIKDEKFVVPFLYTILRSTGRESVTDYFANKRNQQTVNAFYAAGSYLGKIRSRRTVEVNGQIMELACAYFDSGELYSMGNKGANGNEEGWWMYYYANGELQASGQMINGEKEGAWTYYHDNGLLKNVENYSNGALHGDYMEYHFNGGVSIEAYFEQEMLEREIRWYNLFGNPVLVHAFKAGERNGEAASFFPSGQLKEEFSFLNDQLHGEYKTYHYNGNLALMQHYQHGLIHGETLEYHPNGEISLQGYYNDSGKEEGNWKLFHSNGRLKVDKNYSNGLLRGEVKEYYYNGAINSNRQYNQEGKLDGISEIFDHHGRKIVEETHNDGLIVKVTTHFNRPEGPIETGSPEGTFGYTVYSFDGHKISSGNFLKGESDGEFLMYHRNGNIRQKHFYTNGLLQGQSLTFFPNGQTEQISNYVDGVLEGTVQGFLQSGQNDFTGYFEQDQWEGEWVFYYPFGGMKTKVFARNGSYQGWVTTYAVDEKPQNRMQLVDGGIIAQVLFDNRGNEIVNQDFVKDNRFLIKHAQEHVLAESNILGGEYNDHFTWYHPNGSKLSTRSVILGKDEGIYQRFYYNSNLQETGYNANDQKTGDWIEYYEDGQVKAQRRFFEGMKDSLHIHYFENGETRLVENYFSEKLDGELSLFDIHGELMITIVYQMDEIVGFRYIREGQLIEMIPFNEHDQTIIAYYNNGTKSYEQHFQNFLPHGPQIKYYADGTLMEYREFESGFFHGKGEAFYPNGKPHKQYFCELDMYEGEFIVYWPSGNPREIINYLHDQKHGLATFFHSNGQTDRVELYWSGNFIGFQ